MFEIKCDTVIIGGGPAGLSAAVAAKKESDKDVLIIERDEMLGGILQQCIHPGFGLNYFKEELTGPEYAERFEKKALELGVRTLLNTVVLEIIPEEETILCINNEHGLIKILSKSFVLAMGCRERTRANIMIPGTRPAGIYTAGSAQRLVNRQNEMVGKKIIILGSGDIGMIMARRMTLEGAKVIAVIEIMDYLAGLMRNKVQCLDDFGIPLKLSHTITEIIGYRRVKGVKVSAVDENKNVIPGTDEYIECDTVLLSVGLIPENELTRKAEIEISPLTNGPTVNQYMQTSIQSVFACGNVVHVNDLVDNVSIESIKAGKYAARYAMGKLARAENVVAVKPGNNLRYICPQYVKIPKENEEITLFFRAIRPGEGSVIVAKSGGNVLSKRKVKRVNPGEIESIKIATGDILKGELTVEIIEEV